MPKIKLPKIGFGTWRLKPKVCKETVSRAIKIGYRMIDTAQAYRNEQPIGKALAESGVPLEEFIIATKVFPLNLTRKRVLKSTRKSLEKLQLEVLDILYVHFPIVTYNAKKTLKAFSELVDQGKVKNIAVSNFSQKLLDEAIAICDKPIVANQVEMHPLLQQKKMLEYLQDHDMYLVAYSPLARGKLNVPELIEVAQKHNASEAQISLAWLMSHENVVPIPKATSKQHQRENFEAVKLKLDSEDIELIDSIKKEKRFLNLPIIGPKW